MTYTNFYRIELGVQVRGGREDVGAAQPSGVIRNAVICWRAMRCPHCDVGISEAFQSPSPFQVQPNELWFAHYQRCPECKNVIVKLESCAQTPQGHVGLDIVPQFLAYPKNAAPRPVPAGVSDPYKQDFEEAVAVLSLSPKASAALSRRNLQAILRDKAGTQAKDLNDQIDEIVDTGKMPSHISESLHAVRNIGNFAAHPIKSKSTGEIVPVEPGEAEWNLDVLESLFDFYFVQPALIAKRKQELNKKLKDAGKPEIQ